MSSDIDRIVKSNDEMREAFHDLNREMGEHRARLATIEKKVDRVSDVLIDGNGRAVVPRMMLMERDIADIKKSIEDLEKRGSGDLPKDRTSELARVEIARAQAKKSIGDALQKWAPLAIALAGLIAAIAALLKGVVL